MNEKHVILTMPPEMLGVRLTTEEIQKDVRLTIITEQDTEGAPFPLVSVMGLTDDGNPVVAKVAHWQPKKHLLAGYSTFLATAVIQVFLGEMRLMRLIIDGQYSIPETTVQWFVTERAS